MNNPKQFVSLVEISLYTKGIFVLSEYYLHTKLCHLEYRHMIQIDFDKGLETHIGSIFCYSSISFTDQYDIWILELFHIFPHLTT